MAYRTTLRLLVLLCLPLGVQAQSPELSKTVQESVRVHAPRILLTHARVIEGAGKPAIEDRNVVIEGGKIRAIQAGADVSRGRETLPRMEPEGTGVKLAGRG